MGEDGGVEEEEEAEGELRGCVRSAAGVRRYAGINLPLLRLGIRLLFLRWRC